MPARQLRFVAILGLATLVVVVGACGAVPRPGEVASSTRQTSPSPSAVSGYTAYVSAEVMYSLEYPSSWHELTVSRDGSHYGKDFVSEDIGSPEQLDANGIWFKVQVDTQPSQSCAMAGSISPSVTTRQVSTDGAAGIQYLSSSGAAGPYVLHNSWCYTFGFIVTSTQDLQQHMTEIDHILGTFKFNR